MKCLGYKISGYDATYRKATFDVIERSKGVLEITDAEGGTTFILDLESLTVSGHKTRTWKKYGDVKKKHGVSIAYGSKGWYQQLKYDGKKRKMRTKGEAE